MVYSKNNNGFTLVELAIVITIIALVVAGILSGQTMIKNAKLISVYDDITRFTTAFNSFRDSYRAIPGDLGNLPGASFNNIGTNRNNGAIDWNTADISNVLNDGTNRTVESTLVWQHLFIAGLNDFNPKFTATYTREVGKDNPPSKINGAGYLVWSGATNIFSNNNFNIQLESTGWTPVLSAQDAFFLDSKYDDGKPLTGSIWFITSWASNPAYADCLVAGNQDYKVDSATGDKKSCALNFALPK